MEKITLPDGKVLSISDDITSENRRILAERVRQQYDGFDINQHKKLFELTKNISKNNMIMMSNSNVELVTDSFSKDEFNYKILSCRRAINSKDPSAKTEEVIMFF